MKFRLGKSTGDDMLNKLSTFLLVCVSFLLTNLSTTAIIADETVSIPGEQKKHYLSVCALFKDEAKFLKEWLEFHRLAGVDHFYLYNNNSSDNYIDVLNPYIKEGIVTLMQWPGQVSDQDERNAFRWALSTQVPAYQYTISTRAKETEWLAFVDVDEFLVPNHSNLKQILERYENHPGVVLSSDFFDVSDMNVLPKRNLIIETVEMVSPPHVNKQKSLEKMIFKPALCQEFLWPNYRCVFKNSQRAVKMSKNEMRINRYTNRKKIPWHFKNLREQLHIDSRMLAEDEKLQLLEIGYEIVDQERAIFRFVPELLEQMRN